MKALPFRPAPTPRKKENNNEHVDAVSKSNVPEPPITFQTSNLPFRTKKPSTDNEKARHSSLTLRLKPQPTGVHKPHPPGTLKLKLPLATILSSPLQGPDYTSLKQKQTPAYSAPRIALPGVRYRPPMPVDPKSTFPPDRTPAKRVYGTTFGKNTEDRTKCWEEHPDEPNIHVLECYHVVNTQTPLPCGPNCHLQSLSITKPTGKPFQCKECERRRRWIEHIEARKCRTPNIFMPRPKRKMPERGCKDSLFGPIEFEDEEGWVVDTEDDFELAPKKKAKLDATLAIHGTDKLKTGAPARRRAVDDPFFAVHDRPVGHDELKNGRKRSAWEEVQRSKMHKGMFSIPAPGSAKHSSMIEDHDAWVNGGD